MTNAVSNNTNTVTTPTSTVSPVDQTSTTTTIDNFGMAQIKSDEFSSTIANTNGAIAEVDSKIKGTKDEKKKKELKTKKDELVNRKKELQDKKASLKSKMAQLKAEIAGHKIETESTRTDLNKLSVQKKDLETKIQNENKDLSAKNQMLTGVNGKIAGTKAELDAAISDLNKSAADLTKKSEDQLKAQRTAISDATTEAMELVKSGELKAEDMPSYISGKLADFSAGGNISPVVLDSQNAKVKMLCSQIAGYVNNQGNIQLAIKASSSKLNLVSPVLESINKSIKDKSDVLQTGEAALSLKQSELDSSSVEYASQDTEMTNVDTEIASVDSQIVESEVDPAQTEETTQEPVAQYPQFFLGGQGAVGLNINLDEEFSKIDAKSALGTTDDVKNSDIDGLKVKMSDADKLITTLRNHLSDTAQKIIEERLEATKRR